MKLETFFEKFDQFADAPNAVAKMRELVLELAVRGKLVEQDADDEPASDLLERVRGERRQLADKGSLKTKVHLPQVGADDQPYVIPETWLWVPLNEITELVYGKLLPTSDLLPKGFPVFGANGIIGFFSKYLYKDEMLLISCRGAYSGTPNISPPNCFVTNNSIVCEFFDPTACDIRFFHSVISVSPRKRIVTGSAQPQVTVANAIKLPVPLPPLAEQKRIVAKVDELMALCDRLEAQQQERETRHAALARASLARFSDAPTSANLNYLFHPSFNIHPSDFRKSILTLAVQGKLVPQDPTDEPAEASFSELAAAGVESDDDAVPSHWLRVPLGKMGEWRGGGTPSKSRPEFWKGDLPWVSPKDMKVPYIADAQDHISPAAVEGSSVRLIPPGSLLMVVRGMILARAFPVAQTTREVTINQDMKALLPSEPKTKEYLLVALRAFEPDVLDAIEHSSHGTCKLKTEFLQDFVVPIPPLAEQKRIVAKVDQLMALVEELETKLSASRKTAEALMEAAVAELTGGEIVKDEEESMNYEL